MYFQPQINFLLNINTSQRLSFITRKSYGFCVFYKILNHNINNSEISLTALHNSILGIRPTILSLTTYIKSSSPLYRLENSRIKKTQKHIVIVKEAMHEFKQIAKIYLNELKDQENDFHRFFNEDLIHS